MLFNQSGGNLTVSPPGSVQEGDRDSGAWYEIYFTEPTNRENPIYEGGPGSAIAEAISGSKISVDVAAYKLNLWEIRDALIEVHRRGVGVRIILDSENLIEPEIQEIIDSGIKVVDDRSDSLMHNKFIIIDRQEVWTGSMNPTLGGAYYDNNNMIRIKSLDLAKNYVDEFNEMFTQYRFSRGSIMNTAYPQLWINGSLVETYFSPEDGTGRRIIDLINSAEREIYFLAYSFTSDEIAGAIVERAQSGVVVKGVMDSGQYKSNTGTEFDRLVAGGADVYLDGNPANMHHKIIIIDNNIVITGSYNFSNSAENKNDENTLIIHDKTIAGLYMEEFWRVYNEATR
jgi:phosphatidylserine/phosphatidylglycerophosphate/cardiolipin synthase-like enzyme